MCHNNDYCSFLDKAWLRKFNRRCMTIKYFFLLLILGISIISTITVSASYWDYFGDFYLENEVVQVEQKIVINAPIEKVCSFVTNPLKDFLWRTEVHSISANGDVTEVGTVFTEDAFIALKRHFITKTELIKHDCPREAIFVTTDDNPFYLKSRRYFKSLAPSKTEFSYIVDFDTRMIKETIGLRLRPALVKALYERRMKNYLIELRKLLKVRI